MKSKSQGPLGLDLNHWKHVKSDNKSTVLQHKNGHQLTIAHSALPAKSQAALKALSPIAKENATQSQAQEAQDQSQYGKVLQKAKGGPVANEMPGPSNAVYLAEGGDSESFLDKVQKVYSGSFGEATKDAEAAQKANKANGSSPSPNPSTRPVNGWANGGDVTAPNPDQPPGNSAPVPSAPAQSSSGGGESNEIAQAAPEIAEAMARGGKVQKYAEGTKEVKADDASFDSAKALHEKLDNLGSFIKKHVIGEPIGPNGISTNRDNINQSTDQDTDDTTPPPTQQPAANPTLASAPSAPSVPQSSSPAATTPQSNGSIPDIGELVSGSYQKGQEGIEQGGKAMEAKALAEQDLYNKQVAADATAQKAFQNGQQQIEAERVAHIQDIQNGYIDPNKYWTGYTAANGEQVPGHSKIAAGIGMILAGFNPTNNPNAAINFLKMQIDNSMTAQAKNLDSQQNLLRANLEHFRNFREAADMTRLQLNDALAHKLGQAAATAATPMAKAQALQAQSQLMRDTVPLSMQMYTMRALSNLGAGTGKQDPQANAAFLGRLQVTNPELYKTESAKAVPTPDGGVEFSHLNVSQEDKNKLIGHQQLASQLADLQNFVKTHNTVNPYSKDYVIGQQKALALQAAVRDGTLRTVYREGEQPLLDKFVKENPAGIGKWLTQAQLSGLQHTNNMQYNVFRNGIGLGPQSLGGNSDSPQPVKGKDGRMYVRQGNYMVPVK